MAVDVLLGLQWGDEGKGKVVDVFGPLYDIVARFQGGPNAGHTIEFGGAKYVLHLIPSGIFHEGVDNLIGNGVVIDPVTLRTEIERLLSVGIPVRDRLKISRKAHLILPSHKRIDAAMEAAAGDHKIGSTLRGIGPTYRDKIGRSGLRIGDIQLNDFRERYDQALARHRDILRSYGADQPFEADEAAFFDAIDFIRSLQLVDSEHYLHHAMAAGKKILAEGAQGSMLDIDFGTYPFVTSSNTITAGACTGLGIAPRTIGRVYGIFKAYCTRVGGGPFPTELHGEEGEKLRQAGREFGATTGRPRRCGWIDLPALRYAIRLNGVTDLIMTKADVLATFPEIWACEAYNVHGVFTEDLPYSLEENIQPVYRHFPAWQQDLTGIRAKEDLPKELMQYIAYVEEQLQTPVTYLSVGPDREQTLAMAPALAL